MDFEYLVDGNVVIDASIETNLELYKKVMTKVYSAGSDEEKKKIFDDFSDRYLIPRSMWWARECFQMNSKERDAMAMKALKHFCSQYANRKLRKFKDRHLSYTDPDPWTLPAFHEEYHYEYAILDSLHYPHERLSVDLRTYEQMTLSPISEELKKTVKKMEKIYYKIQDYDEPEEIIDIIIETGDPVFGKQFFENLLHHLYHKGTWKLYIKYLAKTDPQEMLQVYAKYCRYFLDDFEMKKEYQREVEKQVVVVGVPWKNPFEFEEYLEPNYEEEVENARAKLKMPEKNVKDNEAEDDDSYGSSFWDEEDYNYLKNNTKYSKVNIAKFRPQYFPFQFTTLTYLFDRGSTSLTRKLHQTCKQLFFVKPVISCYRLSLSDEYLTIKTYVEFLGNSINCNEMDFQKIKMKHFHPTMIFDFQMENIALSDLIIKGGFIHQCDAKYISIANQILTKKELEFLVGSAEDLRMQNCKMLIDETETVSMTVEEILELLPKIRVFGYDTDSVETSNEFSNLKFVNKIDSFGIKFVENEIDVDDFYAFIEENAAPFSHFYIKFFKDKISRAFMENFGEQLCFRLEQWQPEYSRPRFYLEMDP